MEKKKKLRCPIGIPGGIIATILAITGIVLNSLDFNWFGLLISIALLLVAMPFIRIIMMVHSANDRLDEIESKLKE
jgi:hypothetical protein